MPTLSLDQLPSPALLFRESTIDQNLDLMVRLSGCPDRLRPHVKTHKCPNIIAKHISRGITKFKCATIAEVEMVAQCGAASVLLAKQPVGPDIHRLIRLADLFPKIEFLAIVDNQHTHACIKQALEDHSKPLGLYVDVDCGMQRSGIAPGNELMDLYREISGTASTPARGFHVYDGHLHDPNLNIRRDRCANALKPVFQIKDSLEKEGFPVPTIVAGGSPTFAIHADNSAITECSPGTTVLWDTGYQDHFPDLAFEPAAFLLTRVISRLSEDALCLDLGHKGVSADKPQPRVRFDQLPDASMETHSEEHLVVRHPDCSKLKPGDWLMGIPTHVCPTVALYDEAFVLSDTNEVIDQWPISARKRKLTV